MSSNLVNCSFLRTKILVFEFIGWKFCYLSKGDFEKQKDANSAEIRRYSNKILQCNAAVLGLVNLKRSSVLVISLLQILWSSLCIHVHVYLHWKELQLQMSEEKNLHAFTDAFSQELPRIPSKTFYPIKFLDTMRCPHADSLYTKIIKHK